MKKIITACLLLIVLAIFAGCGQKSAGNSSAALKIGASSVPHAEILNVVKPMLAKEGVELNIVEMNDYITPNVALAEKELDGNFFQHIPYLEQFAKDHSYQLTYSAKVHIEPMGIYSTSVKGLKDIKSGAKVAIPNDPTNGGRALLLLEKAGLLKLKSGVGIKATTADIVDNPLKLKFVELDAPQLPRSLGDVAIAVINANYAMEAKLSPTKDALFLEQKDSPYVNILAIRKGDENRPELQKLAKALNSDEVRKFIDDKYAGAVVPAF